MKHGVRVQGEAWASAEVEAKDGLGGGEKGGAGAGLRPGAGQVQTCIGGGAR